MQRGPRTRCEPPQNRREPADGNCGAYAASVGSGADGDFQTVFWTTTRAWSLPAQSAFGLHGLQGQRLVLRCLWEDHGLAPGEPVGRVGPAGRVGLATPTVTPAARRIEAAGPLKRHPLGAVIDRELDRIDRRALPGTAHSERQALLRGPDTVPSNLVAE